MVPSHVDYVHAPSDQKFATLAIGEDTDVRDEAVAVVKNSSKQHVFKMGQNVYI